MDVCKSLWAQLFCVPILLFGALHVDAQSVQFLKTKHEFGQVANGFFQPAAFPFVNTSTRNVAILSVQSPFYVKARYKRAFVQPGDTGTVFLTIETQNVGRFSESAMVLFSNSDKPQKLQISGEIITVQACFPNKSNLLVREITIVDAETNERIYPSSADFYLNYEKKIPVKTSRIGKTTAEIPIGLHAIRAKAPGYHLLDTVRYIRKSEPIIFLALKADSVPPASESVMGVADSIAPEATVLGDGVAPEDTAQLDMRAYAENNLVFLVDVSLSMKKNGKMDMVKQASRILFDALRSIDQVSIITYNSKAYALAEGVSGAERKALVAIIGGLEPSGLTNGVAGLEMAYGMAKKHRSPTGNNQVILITDGQFTGSQSRQELSRLVSGNSAENIKLSIVSLGTDADVQADLAKMAKKGNGNHIPLSASGSDSLLLQEIKTQSHIQQ